MARVVGQAKVSANMGAARWSALLLLLGLLAGAWVLCAGRLTPERAVVGRVEDDAGPVAGARVRFKGDAHCTLTDRDGRFRLPQRAGGPNRVTAWKDGYFIAGAPADRLPLSLRLTRLPASDYEDYAWIDPTPHSGHRLNCGNCHGEIYREWSASGHARSATGRHFVNLYDGSDWHGKTGAGWNLLADHPDGAGVCTACHAPSLSSFNDPAYSDLRQVRGVAARGVHCDYCHKIADAPTERLGQTHGRFNLTLLRPAGGQLFFGPLDDVDRHEDTYSPLYRESRYCASCHEGIVFGVHVYSTYSEWLESPARKEGKHCQTCHMAPTGRMTNLAPGNGGVERDPWTLANHRFFDVSQTEMLRRCLHVAVSFSRGEPGALAPGDSIRIEVEVLARDVGHRVPTGFVDRHLLLLVEGIDKDGQRLHPRTGPLLPATVGKQLAGMPGRLYAKQLRSFDGRSPAPFWRADGAAVDTRLTPGQPDRTVFVFPAELDRLRLRLLYRRFWQEVAETKGWPDNEIAVIEQTLKVGAANSGRGPITVYRRRCRPASQVS
jgi:hypothetical protein